VYQRNFGGLAELAADMKLLVETELEVKMFGLLEVLVKPVKGK